MEAQNPSSEILHDFSPRVIVYKDGRVERLVPHHPIPPSFDPKTRVQSKDVVISPNVSARMFLPKTELEITKLPLLIYFHGGAFVHFSPTSTVMHNYLNSLVSKANVVGLSVEYRLAPENPIPACYDDAWEAIQWATSHANGTGPDPWLNQRVDFKKIYLGGESAGANISHNVLDRIGLGGLLDHGVSIAGVVLVHPFFGDGQPDRLWNFVCPSTTGVDDPWLNPMADPARMKRAVGSRRVFVCVDKGDWLRERGVKYVETLKESGWEGEVELVETNGAGITEVLKQGASREGEADLVKSIGSGHVFYLWNLESHEAQIFLGKIASFINNSIV